MAGFAVLYSQPFVFSLNKKFGVGNIAALNLLTKRLSLNWMKMAKLNSEHSTLNA